MDYKKGQISIFIIIMMILIILFIFLFSFQTSSDERKIDDGTNLAGEKTYNFENLQTELNFCLNNGLEKAVILASSKGGLIYDEGGKDQKTTPNIYFEEYKKRVLNPYDIQGSDILQYTKLTGKSMIELPISDDVFRGELILPGFKNQFQEYILNEIFDCVNFEEYSNDGLIIDKKVISTSVKQKVNNVILELNPIEGENDDTLFLEIGDKLYEGKLSINDGKFYGDFSTSSIDFSDEFLFTNYNIINKDLSVYVEINFEEEKIFSTLYFPVVLREKNIVISSLSSNADIDSRFLKIVNTADILTKQKLRNRSLDYGTSSDLSTAINGYIGNISVSKTTIENRPEYKKFIYSINDLDSQFLGYPIKFNFAYENYAPWLRLDTDSTICYKVQGDICMVLFTPGTLRSFSLAGLTDPIEPADSLKIIFDEKNILTSYSQFNITKEGLVSFNTSQGGIFNYDISIQDGESYNEYTLRFISGSIENINNADAISCLVVENTLSGEESIFYPIGSKFLGVGNTMKLFDGNDGTSKKLPFVYSLQQNNIVTYNPLREFMNVKVSETCVENSSQYKVEWSGLPWDNTLTKDFQENISIKFRDSNNLQITEPYKISAQILDLSNTLVGEPLELMVYPTTCLGSDIDGTGISCCDSSLLTSHSVLTNLSDRESISIYNTLTNTQHSIPMFFGLLLNGQNIEFDVSQGIDLAEINIWDGNYGTEVSSLYKANVEVTCSDYPQWQHNIKSIGNSSGQFKGTVNRIDTFNSPIDNITFGGSGLPLVSINLNVEQSADSCSFGIVENKSILVEYTTTEGEVFQLVGGLSNNGVQTIPQTPDYSDFRVLCDNTWKGYAGSSVSLNFEEYSTSTLASTSDSFRSKGFCSQGSTQCGVADPSKNFSSWDLPGRTVINGGICTKTYFENGILKYFSESSSKSSGFSVVGSRDCINNSNGAVVGSRDIVKELTCGDSDPITTDYKCTRYQFNSSQPLCPIGSTLSGSLPLDVC